jgi:leucyl-tRNA synthetase
MLYDHASIEAKWQARWEAEGAHRIGQDRGRPKFYVLDMFPYPSGAGLHVGHPKGYVATDVVARARRMMGMNVLRVMGWDSFGLPAERQAVREDRHPAEITARNIATFKGQLQRLGLAYDWTHELATSDPRYYAWTQWIFLRLHERGLAYQADVPVHFCPALGTVLANEEVKDGRYVETGDPVERRVMKQWMLRITAYADALVDDLEQVDWPEGIKQQQRDWIGRSHGANVRFALDGRDDAVEVFTTRPDTLFGGTYVVLAPEHPLVDALTTPDQRSAVAAMRARIATRSDRDRTSAAADAPKLGAWLGSFAVNPVNGAKIPVWIADYVLGHYGTGAVFACPAHDERDHAFARQYGLPIVEVVAGGDPAKEAWTGDGPHVRSDFLDGLDVGAAKKAVVAWLAERGLGEGVVRYRLRDWLFSRQRYWGEPFPLVHTASGQVVPLPESALPVVLPDLDSFRPAADHRLPLERAEQWLHTTHPVTGEPVRREVNTMPQWAGSCWYYLRFLAPWRDDVAWSPEDERYWMPVDLYVGGAEHAVLHLLYARFWHKVLYDLGLVHTREPFQRLFNQGMIHAVSYQDAMGRYWHRSDVEERDGAPVVAATGAPLTARLEKMSKSRYNVTNPDDVCRDQGADALRLYELFMGPLEDGATWEDAGVAGTRRFLDKAWRLVVDPETGGPSGRLGDDAPDRDVERALHRAIQAATEAATDTLRFHTAIAHMMVFVNEANRNAAVWRQGVDAFVRILFPFAPHVACELWERLGHTDPIQDAPWPAFDPEKLVEEMIEVAVQVNGKLRVTLRVPRDTAAADLLAQAKADERVARWITGPIRREVVVPGRLVNLVV